MRYCTLPCVHGGQISPLVIDTASKGVRYTDFGENVRFDLGEGARPTHWIGNPSSVLFLVADKNGDGQISSIQEMFGNNTVGPDGKLSDNGFDALAKHDANTDKKIDSKDPIWKSLRLWSDENTNAKTDKGELRSLEDFYITAIPLAYKNTISQKDHFGNMSRQRGNAEIEDGKKTIPVYDVWFVPASLASLRGAGAGRKSSSRMPNVGDPHFKTVMGAWKDTIARENFTSNELPFNSGSMRTIRGESGNVQKRIAIWKHKHDTCRVEIQFSPNWKVLDGFSRCS